MPVPVPYPQYNLPPPYTKPDAGVLPSEVSEPNVAVGDNLPLTGLAELAELEQQRATSWYATFLHIVSLALTTILLVCMLVLVADCSRERNKVHARNSRKRRRSKVLRLESELEEATIELKTIVEALRNDNVGQSLVLRSVMLVAAAACVIVNGMNMNRLTSNH